MRKFYRPWVFIIPGLILGLLTLGIPIYEAIKNSFYNIRLYRLGSEMFIGLENYIRLLNDPIFLLAFRVSLIFAIGCTVLVLLFSILVSSVLTSYKIEDSILTRPLMALFIVPFVTTQVVTGIMGRTFIWQTEFGLVNYLLNLIYTPVIYTTSNLYRVMSTLVIK